MANNDPDIRLEGDVQYPIDLHQYRMERKREMERRRLLMTDSDSEDETKRIIRVSPPKLDPEDLDEDDEVDDGENPMRRPFLYDDPDMERMFFQGDKGQVHKLIKKLHRREAKMFELRQELKKSEGKFKREKKELSRMKDIEWRKIVQRVQEQCENDYKKHLQEQQETLNRALRAAHKHFAREQEKLRECHSVMAKVGGSAQQEDPDIEESVQTFIKEKQILTDQVKEFKKAYSSLEEREQSLSQRNHELEEKVERLGIRYESEKHMAVKSIKEESEDTLRTVMQDSEAQIATRDSKISQLEWQVDTLQSEVDQMQEQIVDMEEIHQSVKSPRGQIQEEVAMATDADECDPAALAEARHRIEMLENELEKTRMRVEEAEQETQHAMQKLRQRELDLGPFEDMLMRQRQEAYDKAMEEFQGEHKVVVKERDDLKDKVDDLHSSIANLSMELRKDRSDNLQRVKDRCNKGYKELLQQHQIIMNQALKKAWKEHQTEKKALIQTYESKMKEKATL